MIILINAILPAAATRRAEPTPLLVPTVKFTILPTDIAEVVIQVKIAPPQAVAPLKAVLVLIVPLVRIFAFANTVIAGLAVAAGFPIAPALFMAWPVTGTVQPAYQNSGPSCELTKGKKID